MATDYNAKLITELYATKDAEEATKISGEMVGIGDNIFPRQIYEAYKKFKQTSKSHYFVSDLTKFQSSDTLEILKDIVHTTTRYADIKMMLEYLTNIEYFNPEIINKIMKMFTEEIIGWDISSFSLEKSFWYFERYGQNIDEILFLLKTCFEDEKQDLEAKKMALKKLLKSKPKEYIAFYNENYESIKNTKAENIFVKEISTWSGGIISSLHKKILESGSSRAKEILQEQLDKKKKENVFKEKQEQKEIKEEYGTSDVLSDLSILRWKINKISISDKRFEFFFFSPFEEIYQQGKPAKDKSTLIGYCMVLRSLIGNFSNEIMKFKISEKRALELVPDIKDLNGSINKFHLLLLDKGIDVDAKLFGLRNINRIITKFAAHTTEETNPELISILKEEKMFDFYNNDDWSKLHREILLRYKVVLEKILQSLATH